MSIVKPLATALVNGRPVRYFRSPLDGPEFPWHVFLDLHAAMRLPDDMQEHFLRMMRSGPYRNDTRVLATPDGPAVITPHYVAQGFMRGMEELGQMPPDFEIDYCKGLSDAIDAQASGLACAARFELVIAMGRRHIGKGDAH
jgi:hypothetical protein